MRRRRDIFSFVDFSIILSKIKKKIYGDVNQHDKDGDTFFHASDQLTSQNKALDELRRDIFFIYFNFVFKLVKKFKFDYHLYHQGTTLAKSNSVPDHSILA